MLCIIEFLNNKDIKVINSLNGKINEKFISIFLSL